MNTQDPAAVRRFIRSCPGHAPIVEFIGEQITMFTADATRMVTLSNPYPNPDPDAINSVTCPEDVYNLARLDDPRQGSMFTDPPATSLFQ